MEPNYKEQRNKLLEVCKEIAEVVKNSDEWWMDSPDRGGIDLDKLEQTITECGGDGVWAKCEGCSELKQCEMVDDWPSGWVMLCKDCRDSNPTVQENTNGQ